MPHNEGAYILDTDASDVGPGAVLSQIQDGVERPVAYVSRSLIKSERTYCTTRKELLAIVYGLKQYKHYVLGTPLRVRTDHSALQWLRRTTEPVAQQARWLEFIEQFQYTIEHRPGHRHNNADALSRRPIRCSQCTHCDEQDEIASDCPVVVRVITSQAGELLDSTTESLALAQQADPEIGPIVRLRLNNENAPSVEELSAESEVTKSLHAQWFRLCVKNGVVYRTYFSKTGEPDCLQLLVPKTLRNDMLGKCHTGMTGGHFVIKKTCDQVQRRAYWPGWRGDTLRYCKRCTNCVTYHRSKLPKQGLLQPVLAGAPMERLSIDLSNPHPRTQRGSVYILACIDAFSKWVEVFPIPNKEAATVARVLVEQVFCRLGTPLSLLSDQGNEVNSSILREVCKLLDIDKLHTTPYKPSTNPTERLNRTLNSMIGKVVNDRQNDWDLLLPYLAAAIRNARQETTGYTPNILMLNREVRMPIDVLLGDVNLPPNVVTTYDDFVEDAKQRLTLAFDIVRDHLRISAQRNKRQCNLRPRQACFKTDDLVYYYNPRRYQGKQDKWRRLFTGPFTVKRQVGPVNYEIQKNVKSKPFIVHVDKLELCSNDENEQDCPQTQNNVTDNSSGIPDVVTFDTNQEFRRTRPRRQIRIPLRYSKD